QELLESDTEEPILARWRVGLGWTLAWTTDVKTRWAVEWVRWAGWERFWGQLVREHMRQKHRRELTMKAEIVGGQLHASVDAFTADERFENNLQSKLIVSGPEPVEARACKTVDDCKYMAFGSCKPESKTCESKPIPLQQVAPGRYEAAVTVD